MELPSDVLCSCCRNGRATSPSAHQPFAGALHVGSWRARLLGEDIGEVRSSWRSAIAKAIGLEEMTVLRDMPPLEELSVGLEELIAG